MDTSRERGPEEGASIRLRYSRQFQSGGHAHSIDAEATLPVGANSERREQVIRELEGGVEQLARQIAQRASRSSGEARPQQPSGRPAAASSAATAPVASQGAENAALPALPMQKPATGPQPAARPVSESMPATPAASSEGPTVKLAQFINAIKKRWNMSLNEAMDLLHVTSLEGVNLREAYSQLQGIIEAKNSPTQQRPNPNPQPRITQAPPIVEAPRQDSRNAPQQSPSRFPPNPAPPSSPGPRAQAPIALREVSRPAPPTVPVNTPRPEPSVVRELPRGVEMGADFAGSPKAPLPIKLATVRDVSARNDYKFDEEDDDEGEYELPDDGDLINLRAQSKLDELKTVRGSNAASAERLTVLSNITDGLVSETDLMRLIKGIWGHATPKKLKTIQVEKLISWAKEDDFAAEVEAVLELLQAEEGE